MSVWVTLQMTVKPGEWAALMQFLEARLPAVRGFDGALSVTVHGDEGTGAMMIFEEWLSREHHQAYIAAIQQNGVFDQLLAFMVAPPDVRHYARLTI